jgi:ornithine carbamoyltransferase
MKSQLYGKDYISTEDWTREELETAIEVAFDLKRKWAMGIPHEYLRGKTLFMLFFEESTRTRNSFEAGMTQLGGHAHDLTPEKTQIGHGESPKDTAMVLSRYGHGIGIRDCTYGWGNNYIREVAKWADIPVYNMQDDVDHPCQALGDLMTIMEKFGSNTRGLKFVISWTYAPAYTRPLSVPQSLIMLMPRFGMDVVLAHPPEFKLMPKTLEAARRNAEDAGVKFEIVDDMDAAFEGADIVYPKSWGPLEVTQDPNEIKEILNRYRGWICNEDRMALTQRHSIYMHCMPADRGYEVTDGVIDGPHSVIYDQAENRLHIQKSIMTLTMGGRF